MTINSIHESPYNRMLKNRIDLITIPFSERGSRLMIFRSGDQFKVRLAERWFKLTNQLSAYRTREPIIDEWVFTGDTGETLPTEAITFPDHIEINTPLGRFSLAFVDTETIQVGLPAGRFGIGFRANLNEATPDRRGGVLRLTGDIRRNIAYTTNAEIISQSAQPVETSRHQIHLALQAQAGNSLLINVTPRLGFNRYVPPMLLTLAAAQRRWKDWFDAVPDVLDRYQKQYYFAWWIMGAGLISSRFYTTREAMTPSKSHYVGIWQWDAFFHALAYRHANQRLAQDQLRIVLDHQLANGMIPDAIHDEGIVTHLEFPVEADVTKPPLVAWAAWKLFEVDGDREFLEEIYGPIVRWNRWWFEQNDADRDGLCEYNHPFSSGLDDSPLWDSGMPVTSPDLNTYLCLQQECLAKMAQEIGEASDAQLWDQRAAAIARRMQTRLWDEKEGLFWAMRAAKPIRIKTPFSLFPLITGRMPQQVNRRLVEHLVDEHQFWPRFPVPSVALDDPHYDPNQMWRGPTWVNVNYLLIEGLYKCGFHSTAAALRRRTLDLIAAHPDIYEYYHPQTGQKPPHAAAIFGWSSAVFIDLAIAASRDEEAGGDQTS